MRRVDQETAEATKLLKEILSKRSRERESFTRPGKGVSYRNRTVSLEGHSIYRRPAGRPYISAVLDYLCAFVTGRVPVPFEAHSSVYYVR